MKSISLLIALLAAAVPFATGGPADPALTAAAKKPVKVACVGDSITQGSKQSQYPADLQQALGEAWEVRNFGHSGFTLLKKGDKSYWKSPRYQQALAYLPDVVVIKLGTNDTKPQNWKFKDEFVADYQALVRSFQDLPSQPRVYVCLPCPVIGKGNWGINNAGIEQEMVWIREIADSMHLGLIDLNSIFAGKPELLPDRVHPNPAGHALMAAAVAKVLTGREPAAP